MYSKAAQEFLIKHGWEHVKSLEIVRTPLSKNIETLLNFVTLGQFSEATKASSYDKMFHLAMLVETDEGHYYQFEKNETIRLGNPKGITNETERIHVVLPRTFQIGQLLQRGEKYQGAKDFFRYSAFAMNCQSFVMAILKGSKLDTPAVKAFVKQDALKILKKLPFYTEKVANFLTDLAAIFRTQTEPEAQDKEHTEVYNNKRVLAVYLNRADFTLHEAKQYIIDNGYKLTIPQELPKYYKFPQSTADMAKLLHHVHEHIPHGYLILGVL